MSCIGSILKQLLDFTYVRSKDDEKINNNSRPSNGDGFNGSDDKDRSDD